MNVLMALGPGESLSAPDWQRQILALTTRHRVTFYDAAYHALAIVNEGIFVTADEKYLKAVGDDKHAMHLKDWR
jgi:predicted nucleic acid-binding protein